MTKEKTEPISCYVLKACENSSLTLPEDWKDLLESMKDPEIEGAMMVRLSEYKIIQGSKRG